MPRRLLLALLALVAAPLVLLGWVSTSALKQSQAQAQQQYVGLLVTRLSEIDQAANKLFNDYARELTQEVSANPDQSSIDTLRQMRRKNPVVRQGVLVSSDGQILFPPRPSPDDADAMNLYAALPGMVSSKPDGQLSDNQLVVPPAANQQAANQQATKPQADMPNESRQKSANLPALSELVKGMKQQRGERNTRAQQSVKSRFQVPVLQQASPQKPARDSRLSGEHLWQVWYMDRGMQLILWLPRNDDAVVGIILERPRWTSDLTALLPDSTANVAPSFGMSPSLSKSPSSVGFTTLMDESKQIVYRWGDEGPRSDHPVVSVPMSAPLSTWQWEFHGEQPIIGQTSSLPLIASFSSIGLLLLSLGAYVLTSVGRQMRAARNRVSFAGQVSHELRTPLTNIRLYTELAESDLDQLPDSETRDSVQRRLGVIDSECKRLSRLVSGVLEMIRSGKKARGPRMEVVVPDQLIEETLQQFAPSFKNSEIQVNVEADASREVQMDPDIFEMVLVNLLSNVEKYASSGKSVTVRSELNNDELVVTVADDGPGIGRQHQRSVFKPFARLDDSINAPSGTGIGLTIARKAAIRHGGQLQLVPSQRGACFELRIPVAIVVKPHSSPRPSPNAPTS